MESQTSLSSSHCQNVLEARARQSGVERMWWIHSLLLRKARVQLPRTTLGHIIW